MTGLSGFRPSVLAVGVGWFKIDVEKGIVVQQLFVEMYKTTMGSFGPLYDDNSDDNADDSCCLNHVAYTTMRGPSLLVTVPARSWQCGGPAPIDVDHAEKLQANPSLPAKGRDLYRGAQQVKPHSGSNRRGEPKTARAAAD